MSVARWKRRALGASGAVYVTSAARSLAAKVQWRPSLGDDVSIGSRGARQWER